MNKSTGLVCIQKAFNTWLMPDEEWFFVFLLYGFHVKIFVEMVCVYFMFAYLWSSTTNNSYDGME